MIFTQRVNSQLTQGFDIIRTQSLCFITELRRFRIREEDDECQVVCNYASWLCRASCQGTAAAAVCCSVSTSLQHPGELCTTAAMLMSRKNGPSDDDKWCHEYPVTRHVTSTWHGPSSPEPINKLPKRSVPSIPRVCLLITLPRTW